VNHSVESGLPLKSRFGGQGATPWPDSEYDECICTEIAGDIFLYLNITLYTVHIKIHKDRDIC